MKIKHVNNYIKHYFIKTNDTHSIKLNKNIPTHVRTTYISKLNNNSQIQENKAITMKYLEKIRKPITFLEDWSWDDEEQWRFLKRNTVSLWERWTDKTMNSQKCSRENWKVLKTILKAQNMRFSRLNQVNKHFVTKKFEKLV